jgi:hypothetical protein
MRVIASKPPPPTSDCVSRLRFPNAEYSAIAAVGVYLALPIYKVEDFKKMRNA